MTWLEQLAISVIIGILQQVVKNPTHAAELESILVGLANDIYETYGLTPPAPAPTPAGSAEVRASLRVAPARTKVA